MSGSSSSDEKLVVVGEASPPGEALVVVGASPPGTAGTPSPEGQSRPAGGGAASGPLERQEGPGEAICSADAADQAVRGSCITLDLPFGVHLELPGVEHLAWYGAVGALAALGVVDWPVALVLGIGKALADNRSSQALRDFGQALDEVL